MSTYKALHLQVPAWTRENGTPFEWDQTAFLHARIAGGETVIEGNSAGFEALARVLLTLSATDVPPGTHVHLGTFEGLAAGTTELILERVSSSPSIRADAV